jgi:hypothetical protein
MPNVIIRKLVVIVASGKRNNASIVGGLDNFSYNDYFYFQTRPKIRT